MIQFSTWQDMCHSIELCWNCSEPLLLVRPWCLYCCLFLQRMVKRKRSSQSVKLLLVHY
ncbi:baculoviral IAP repeat containing 6 [Rhinolophus ferrumequinum]|uniref:Baculoviral IAP repeat containing 6 n=1 Tax=Rhinolophus ferrumequinum TaxID=59479 RepID=A0A7J7V701_RHIFE|nr:baculoviral IAP repeat containing 6 [Rhinolophus ferrumequinum]